jgi:hypothetical protein
VKAWISAIVVILAGCSGSKQGSHGHAAGVVVSATKETRTPVLRWTFDDRLNIGAGSRPGVVLTGDKLIVEIDTTQRFASSRSADFDAHTHAVPYFPESAGVLDVPVGMRDFYFASPGNGYVLDDGTCTLDAADPTPKTPAAVACSVEIEKKEDAENWPRDPFAIGTPPIPVPVWRCSFPKGLVLAAGAQRQMRLLRPSGGGYDCAGTWTLKAHDAGAVVAVNVHLKTGTKRSVVGATQVDGVWTVEASLDDAGPAHASVEVRYQDGLLDATSLGSFEVKKQDEHSLVRIQPQLMSSYSLRSVNVGVAITPVSRRFFEVGPWTGPWKKWIFSGISPSAVIRFSGDDTTVLQFGFAASLFVNRSMLFNAGILFGTNDVSQYWSVEPNLFIGFAIDPALLLEARGTER